MEKELDKVYGAQSLLQQSIANIESAQMDVNVYEAMKKGDQVLSDLQKQASLEDFEEMYERIQENEAIKEREREIFGAVLNEEDLQDELDQLDAMIAEDAIPSAPDTLLAPIQRQAAEQQPVNVVADSTGSKRQLVHA